MSILSGIYSDILRIIDVHDYFIIQLVFIFCQSFSTFSCDFAHPTFCKSFKEIDDGKFWSKEI